MTANGASSPIFADASRRFARFAYYYGYFAAWAETV